MTKADDALSTSVSRLNRTPANIGAASPEFRQYLEADRQYCCACELDDKDKISKTGDAHEVAIKALIERPTQSWRDVAELAELVRSELWNEDADGRPIKPHSERVEIERAFLLAALKIGKRCG